MPARKKGINLLPEGHRTHTSLGSIFEWLLGAGRYIIIFTELTVIIAFVLRFKLDRDLTKIYEEIEIKKDTIAAQQSFENEFRSVQENLLTAKDLDQNRQNPQEAFKTLEEITPQTISFTSLSFNQNIVSIDAKAYSSNALATFAYQLLTSPYFTDVKIGQINRGQSLEIFFSLETTWIGEENGQEKK